MPKSSEEKIAFTQALLKLNYTYRDVQLVLKRYFGAGVSNNTLQKLQIEVERVSNVQEELKKCRYELDLYKNLYLELLNAMKEKI